MKYDLTKGLGAALSEPLIWRLAGSMLKKAMTAWSVVILIVLGGCSQSLKHTVDRPAAMNLRLPVTKQDALCRAIGLFPEKRYGPLERYEITVEDDIDVIRVPKRVGWLVRFTAKRPFLRPGAEYFVIVNRETGQVETIDGK